MESYRARVPAYYRFGPLRFTILGLRSSISIYLAPDGTIRQRGSSGIKKHDARIEAMADPDGAIDAPAIAKMSRQTAHLDVPVIARAVQTRIERNFNQRIVAIKRVDDERDGGAVPAQEREIDAGRRGQRGGSERQRSAAVSAKRVQRHDN